MIEMNHISKEKLYEIIDYYNLLFMHHEYKTVSEIATDLNLSVKTIEAFIDYVYKRNKSNADYLELSIKILLCTKFYTNNKYYFIQKKFGPIIDRRINKASIDNHNKKSVRK